MVKRYYAVMAAIILFDRFTKQLAFFLDKPIELLPFFKLQFAWNEGVAFGMLSNFPVLITIINIGIVIAGFFWLHRCPAVYRLPVAFILGGAAGNVIDRLLYGRVVDFFSLSYFSIFNVADIFITAGVILALIYSRKN